MDSLKKQILLKLYDEPGSFIDIKPLLIKIKPDHHDLVNALRYLEKKDKLIEGKHEWKQYMGIVAGKVPLIKDYEFVFRLTTEGERIVRERYLSKKQNRWVYFKDKFLIPLIVGVVVVIIGLIINRFF